jgi:hypothetical protein
MGQRSRRNLSHHAKHLPYILFMEEISVTAGVSNNFAQVPSEKGKARLKFNENLGNDERTHHRVRVSRTVRYFQ